MRKVCFSLFILVTCYSLLITAPIRVVSLAPSHTELLCELGVEEQVVGVTTFCNYPEGILRKEKVGDYLTPNIEKIVSLKPDFIFALTDNVYIEKLRKLKYNVILENPQSIDELKKTILRLGKVTKTDKKAKLLINEIDTITKRMYADRIKSNKTIYIEVFYPPPWSCSKKSFIGEIIDLLGLKNIFAEVKGDYFQVSDEQIIARNPDIFLILSGEKNIAKRKGFSGIAAVKKNKIIYWEDRDLLIRPTMRMIRSISLLKERIAQLQ